MRWAQVCWGGPQCCLLWLEPEWGWEQLLGLAGGPKGRADLARGCAGSGGTMESSMGLRFALLLQSLLDLSTTARSHSPKPGAMCKSSRVRLVLSGSSLGKGELPHGDWGRCREDTGGCQQHWHCAVQSRAASRASVALEQVSWLSFPGAEQGEVAEDILRLWGTSLSLPGLQA